MFKKLFLVTIITLLLMGVSSAQQRLPSVIDDIGLFRLEMEGGTKHCYPGCEVYGNITYKRTLLGPNKLIVPTNKVSNVVNLVGSSGISEIYVLNKTLKSYLDYDVAYTWVDHKNGTKEPTDPTRVNITVNQYRVDEWIRYDKLGAFDFTSREPIQFKLIVQKLERNKMVKWTLTQNIEAFSGNHKVEIDPFFNTTFPERTRIDTNTSLIPDTVTWITAPVNATRGFNLSTGQTYSWCRVPTVNGSIYVYQNETAMQCVNGSDDERLPQLVEYAGSGDSENFSTNTLWSHWNAEDVYIGRTDGQGRAISEITGVAVQNKSATPLTLLANGSIGWSYNFSDAGSAKGFQGSGTSSGDLNGSNIGIVFYGSYDDIAGSLNRDIVTKFDSGSNSLYLLGVGTSAGIERWNCLFRINGADSGVHLTTEDIVEGYHTLVCTWDGSTTRFYIDGVLKGANSAASGALPQLSGDLCMGQQLISENSCGNQWGGTLDFIGMFEYNFSAEEVIAINESFTKPEFWNFGPLEAQSSFPPVVTINAPQNATFLNSSIFINFTVTDDVDSSLECFTDINSQGFNSVGNITNNATYQENLLNLNATQYTLTVNCEDSDNQNGTDTVTWTILHHNITANTFDANQVETNQSNFTLEIDIADNVADINATLIYNDTVITANFESNTSLNYTFRRDLFIPLVEVNATPRLFNWSITVVFDNGTSIAFTSATNTQTVSHAYEIASVNFSSSVAEGDDIIITTTISKKVDNANLTNNITLFGQTFATTLIADTATQSIFRANISSTLTNDTDATHGFNSTLFVNFDDTTRSNYTVHTFVLTTVLLDDCSTATNLVYNFTILDEVSRLPVLSDFESVFTVLTPIEKQFVLNKENTTFVEICIEPDVVFVINATIQYVNDTTHAEREFFLINNATETNSHYNISLFSLANNLATTTQIRVVDQSNNVQRDMIVEIERFYFNDSLNFFQTVSMARTDVDGIASARLVDSKSGFDVFYRFKVLDNGVERNSDASVLGEILTSNANGVIEKTITLIAQAVGQIYGLFNQVEVNCTNTTTTVQCTYNDLSGSLNSTRFLVKQIDLFNTTTICDEILTASSGTFTLCTFGDQTNKSVSFQVLGTFVDNQGDIVTELPLLSSTLDFRQNSIFGLGGVLVALILFLLLAGIGFHNPSVAILMGTFAIVISWGFGFINVGLESVVGLIIVMAIVLYRMRV